MVYYIWKYPEYLEKRLKCRIQKCLGIKNRLLWHAVLHSAPPRSITAVRACASRASRLDWLVRRGRRVPRLIFASRRETGGVVLGAVQGNGTDFWTPSGELRSEEGQGQVRPPPQLPPIPAPEPDRKAFLSSVLLVIRLPRSARHFLIAPQHQRSSSTSACLSYAAQPHKYVDSDTFFVFWCEYSSTLDLKWNDECKVQVQPISLNWYYTAGHS